MDINAFKPNEQGGFISTDDFSAPTQAGTLKLEYPALSAQIDTALQQGWDRNKLRRYLAERESIALLQYTPQEVNQFLGRDENSVRNLVTTMQKQQDDSYTQIMKYDMSESKVRDILITSRESGIAPGVLLLNPDLLPHAEKLAGERRIFFGHIDAAVRNMFANYNQSSANKEHFAAQGYRQAMNDDNIMRDEGLRIWNAGLKTTLMPPSDEELISMGRASYQKRVDMAEHFAQIDERDAAEWAVHVRPPDSKIGNMLINSIQNFGFTGMAMLRTLIGWGAAGPLGGLVASLCNTVDESNSEAGETFMEGLKRGMTPEEAYKRAMLVRNQNLIYLPASNYGADYVFYKGAELIGRYTNPYFAGAGLLGKALKRGVDNAVPFLIDNATEGVEEAIQERFKMKALGDEIDKDALWDAFKMGMADAVIYSLVSAGLNKALGSVKIGAQKIYSMTPQGKAQQQAQQRMQNVLNEIRDMQDIGQKIQNGEIQPDTIVADDPVVFLPKSKLE